MHSILNGCSHFRHWHDVTWNVANTENMEIFNYTAIPTYSLNIMELVKTLCNALRLWLSPLSALSGLLLLLMLLQDGVGLLVHALLSIVLSPSLRIVGLAGLWVDSWCA